MACCHGRNIKTTIIVNLLIPRHLGKLSGNFEHCTLQGNELLVTSRWQRFCIYSTLYTCTGEDNSNCNVFLHKFAKSCLHRLDTVTAKDI